MTGDSSKDIWVFIDGRGRRLFGFSLSVLGKARALADSTGGRLTACLLTAGRERPSARPEGDGCVLMEPASESCLAHGADRVLALENERFDPPRADLFAAALADAVRADRPALVLFALSDFGREVAAVAAARCRAGLIADCREVRGGADGSFVGACPAWGGSILAEIAFAPGWGTGFATVQPQGPAPPAGARPGGEVVRRPVHVPEPSARLRLAGSRPAPEAHRRLENARVVVVGGAGLGSAKAFGKVRELAAALGGEVGGTRPPVMQHWLDEQRMIGQTGKTVAPRLLISIGTSGAAQYTAGIMDSGTIVVVNRDPRAPIFEIADIGVVADANALLPVLVERVQKNVMRRLADVLCDSEPGRTQGEGFGARLKKLREARDWSLEALAESTGQTPDFIQQVEADALAPPVAFLLRLASALNVDPGTFLKKEEQEAIRDRRMESYVRRTQNYSYQTLTEGSGSDHLRAFMVTIEPRKAHKPVAYKHEGEEFIFVMSGELEVMLAEKAHVLKPGEHIHFNSYTPHKLKSLSSEPTRCLVVLYTL
jgi:electron transfer flavoprotein alpha subunit/transcriptional regulator with XRE-family HTH domain